MNDEINYPEIEFGNIIWLKLEEQADEILLLSKYTLEERPYNDVFACVTWETCTLRNYLNGVFFQKFSEKEKGKILRKTNINNGNLWYNVKSSKNTEDFIFCLGVDEVVKYFGDSFLLRNGNPDAAAFIIDQYNNNRRTFNIDDKLPSRWHLRTPGQNYYHLTYVSEMGFIHMSGINNHYPNFGLRPAMWVKL